MSGSYGRINWLGGIFIILGWHPKLTRLPNFIEGLLVSLLGAPCPPDVLWIIVMSSSPPPHAHPVHKELLWQHVRACWRNVVHHSGRERKEERIRESCQGSHLVKPRDGNAVNAHHDPSSGPVETCPRSSKKKLAKKKERGGAWNPPITLDMATPTSSSRVRKSTTRAPGTPFYTTA